MATNVATIPTEDRWEDQPSARSNPKTGPLSSRVLVVEAGEGQARSTLATVRALAASGYVTTVAVTGSVSVVTASRHCARAIRIPPVGGVGFKEAVESEIATGDYLTTLVTADAALLALGAPVEHLLDKTSLSMSAEGAGLEAPPAELFHSAPQLQAAGARLHYPIVVKTVFSGAPALRIDDPAELRSMSNRSGPLLVQPFLSERLRSVAGVMWRDRLMAVIHQLYLRTWPRECGGACAAVSTAPVDHLEEGLVRLMRGFDGIFHAQFSGDYLLDLNPRPYGSLPLATRAGVNLPALYCDLLRGGKAPSAPLRAPAGYVYRWIEGDIRHTAAALASNEMSLRQAAAAWRPRHRVSHGPDSITDPGPSLARLRYAASSGKGWPRRMTARIPGERSGGPG